MTGIEWVKNPDGSQGSTKNPVTGCLNHINGLCKGGLFPCYAWKLAQGRLKQRYLANDNYAPSVEACQAMSGQPVGVPQLDPFYPRFWEERLKQLADRATNNNHHSTPIGVFVCDMSDLFGIGIPEEWTRRVLDVISSQMNYPGLNDRFYLLTKQPQNLIKFSPFPDNCWVGVTATNGKMVDDAGYWLERIDAKVKYLSLEPLLEPIQLYFGKAGIDWLIIGACTGSAADIKQLCDKYPDLDWRDGYANKNFVALPKIEWVRQIVEAADKAGVKVFLKNNLRPLLIPEDCSKPNYLTEDIFWASEKAQLRQELPNVR